MNTIAEKIAKLIAKADSTTHPEEADAFMAKAHQLLEEHGLSLLDLGKLGDDPVGRTDQAYVSSDGWKDKIAFALGRYYGTQIVMVPHTRTSRSYVVFGRESARITFQLMMPFVAKQVAALALQEHRRGAYSSPSRARSAIAGALAVRLYHLTSDKPVRGDATGINAIVPVDIIEAARDEAFPSLRMSRQKLSHDHNARRVAEGVSLNRQTSAPAGTLRIA